jgi:hypothetical protein
MVIGAGPQFVARRGRRTGFTQVLLGSEKPSNEFLPSLQVGVGGDIWMTRMLGIRGGIDGRITWYEEEANGAWRFYAGVVVALGTRK